MTFELGRKQFFLVHDLKKVKKIPDGTDIVIFGHSHKFSAKEKEGLLYLNPGSCGPRRFRNPITYAWLDIELDNGIQVFREEVISSKPRRIGEIREEGDFDPVEETEIKMIQKLDSEA